MQNVVFLIGNDKFTMSYIKFISRYFSNEYNICFITNEKPFHIENPDDNCSMIAKSTIGLLMDSHVTNVLKDADKIILGGFFGLRYILLFRKKNILQKCYIQFWGGDFYKYDSTTYRRLLDVVKIDLVKMLEKRILYYCKANLFLLKEEEKEFRRLTGINKNWYKASVPEDPDKEYSYESSVPEVNNRIILGNSATPSNHHLDILKLLKKYEGQIEIVCPLSYGDSKYAQQICKEGKELFGDKFVPILELMDMQSYTDLLSSCRVGIFFCDRQQAMGNITAMVYLKKKVYLRQGTSMWREYKNNGFEFYDAEQIPNMDIEDFFYQSDTEKENNVKCFKNMYSNESIYEEWKTVLNE